jgi:hypothetical protein
VVDLTVRYPLSSLLHEQLSLDFKDRPSADMGVERPLPVSRPTRGPPTIGPKLPPFGHVPPLPFLPTSTVYSASTSCGCFATRNQPWGSLRFRSWIACTQLSVRDSGPFPVAQDPSKLFPRPQPYHITVARYLLAVPTGSGSRRFDVAVHPAVTGSDQPTSRCCSAAESVASFGVATETPLDAPLGLIPLRGFRRIPSLGSPRRPDVRPVSSRRRSGRCQAQATGFHEGGGNDRP